jgi:hypothetical protein
MMKDKVGEGDIIFILGLSMWLAVRVDFLVDYLLLVLLNSSLFCVGLFSEQ